MDIFIDSKFYAPNDMLMYIHRCQQLVMCLELRINNGAALDLLDTERSKSGASDSTSAPSENQQKMKNH